MSQKRKTNRRVASKELRQLALEAKARRVNVEQLARLIGVHFTTVYRWAREAR